MTLGCLSGCNIGLGDTLPDQLEVIVPSHGLYLIIDTVLGKMHVGPSPTRLPLHCGLFTLRCTSRFVIVFAIIWW